MNKEQSENWEKLRREYNGGPGIILALGAGVSKGSGLPNWPGLFQRLTARAIDGGELDADFFGGHDRRLFNRLCHHGTPLPVIGSVLQQCCIPRRTEWDQRKEFLERVREALYKDFCLKLGTDMKNSDPTKRRELRDDVRKNNETLRAVATLCMVPDKSRKVDSEGKVLDNSRKVDSEGNHVIEANPKIRAVVTFNLDNLFQQYVRARYPPPRNPNVLRTIEQASAASKLRRPMHVYHMHGLLRFDSEAGNPKKESTEVVLTEQDYFDFFNSPTSLFNVTFLYLIREFSCLFIGLSMQDENIRRLLHFSKKERVKSYLDETPNKTEADKTKANEQALRHFAILSKSDSAPVDRATEKSLRALGTRVLWIDKGKYSQIPNRLKRLYGTADWKLVF